MKRVVITGMGIVSPVGCGIEHAWKNILDGRSGVRKIDDFDVSDLPCQIAGLYGFLGERPENLLTVDLFCHGTPSPAVFEKAKAEIASKADSRLVAIEFRKKVKGKKSGEIQTTPSFAFFHFCFNF